MIVAAVMAMAVTMGLVSEGRGVHLFAVASRPPGHRSRSLRLHPAQNLAGLSSFE